MSEEAVPLGKYFQTDSKVHGPAIKSRFQIFVIILLLISENPFGSLSSLSLRVSRPKALYSLGGQEAHTGIETCRHPGSWLLRVSNGGARGPEQE